MELSDFGLVPELEDVLHAGQEGFDCIYGFKGFEPTVGKAKEDYTCRECGGTDFAKQDGGAILICKACGHVLEGHVENVEQEYDQNDPRKFKVRIAKQNQEKLPTADEALFNYTHHHDVF